MNDPSYIFPDQTLLQNKVARFPLSIPTSPKQALRFFKYKNPYWNIPSRSDIWNFSVTDISQAIIEKLSKELIT